MSIDFLSWVNNETLSRGWNHSELARQSGISQPTISRTMSQEYKISLSFCIGIARAFNLPPEDILRKAGLLPPIPEQVAESREADRLMRLIPPERRQLALAILRLLVKPP